MWLKQYRPLPFAVLVLFAATLVPVRAGAADYHLATTGDYAHTGTAEAPSIYEGRAVLERVMSVYASHLNGGRTTLPLQDRRHPLGSRS